jgi:formylglycine-generating enzyme required for sulfatase activity
VYAQQTFETYTQKIPNSRVAFKMVAIPAGTFRMGSPENEADRDTDEGPTQHIQLSGFWMGAFEVTHEEYVLFQLEEKDPEPKPDAITRPSPPYIDLTLGMGKEGGFPANSMQPYAVLMYCKWLWKKTGVFFRPPTEAEWEYACRAGSDMPYFFGKDSVNVSEYAWLAQNSENRYHPVGLKKPNAWGLYDMLGNVSEYSFDMYDVAYFSKLGTQNVDPIVKPKSFRSLRAVRGGSYRDAAAHLRSASRLPADPVWNRRDPQVPKSRWWNADSPFVGFRLVRPQQQPSEAEIEVFFAELLK